MRKITNPTRPRLLIISHNHPHYFPGGTEILAYGLYEELARAGLYETYFLAASNHLTHTLHPGTAIHAHAGQPREFLIWGDRFDYTYQSQASPEILSKDFAELLRELNPDVVHFHHTIRLGMEALSVTRMTLPHARILYTLHDFIPICRRDGQMVRSMKEELCDRATPSRCHECYNEISPAQFKARELFIKTHFEVVDGFIAPSAFLRERYITWGLPAHKLHLLVNGTIRQSPAPFRKLAAKERRNHFAYFGQLSPYKGILLLLEAVQKLRDRGIKNFHVDIHGNMALQMPEFQQRWEAELEACGDLVTYHGRYTHDELPQRMANADWVITPSTWWENAPLVIDEAMTHRRPVICSNIGGMAEKIAHGKNGLHFTAGSAASLAAVMHRAITEKNVWNQLTKQPARVTTLAECALAHHQLYQSLVKEKSPKAKKSAA